MLQWQPQLNRPATPRPAPSPLANYDVMCPGEIYKFAIKIALAFSRNAFRTYQKLDAAYA